MRQPKWQRARAKDRPSKEVKYDRDNSIAAKAILAEPGKHPRFMVEWARRFTARRAAESSQVDRTMRTPGTNGQLPLNLGGVSHATTKFPTTS